MSDTPTTSRHREGLAPEEVPGALDAAGRPREAITPASRVAACHWDASLWRQA